MKQYLNVFLFAALFAVSYGELKAQTRKVAKGAGAKTTAEKKPASANFTPREFGSVASVSDISDVKETSPEYQSLKNLIETNGVILTYADSTFRPKEPLRRGDFIVSFNSALDVIKKNADAGGFDSTGTGAYNTDQDVTNADEIKDLKESSVYYPAAQSLLARGIASPFKSKMLNPGATMSEEEVYSILKSTLGYNSPGANPYATAMTRSKFAMVLNNAVNLKLTQVNALTASRQDSLDDMRRQQEAMIKQQDKQRSDSLAKAAELSRIEAQRKEGEDWNKLSASEKRKQLKKQNSK